MLFQMPALRERIEDIPAIVNQLTIQINKAGSKHPDYVGKKFPKRELILFYHSPGRVILENYGAH